MKREFIKMRDGDKRNLYFISFLLTVISVIIGTTITTKAAIAPASYVIYNDGTTTYAQNGQTGVNDYSGTNAATVIQSAINVLTNGGDIFLKNATYNLTDSLQLKYSNLSFVGEGNAILKLTAVKNSVIYIGVVSLENIRVEGLKIDANYDSIIGIHFDKHVKNFRIAKNEVYNVRGQPGLSDINPCGIIVAGMYGGVIAYNYVHNIDAPSYSGGNGAGIWVTGNIGLSEQEKVAIFKNRIQDLTSVLPTESELRGIQLDTNTWGFSVISNDILNTSGDGVIFMSSAGNICNGHTVSNNHIQNARYGIHLLTGDPTAIRNNLISGNVIEKCKSDGIRNYANNNIFVHNVIKNNMQTGGSGGFLLGDGHYNLISLNEVFDDQSTATQIVAFKEPQSTPEDHNDIVWNYMTGNWEIASGAGPNNRRKYNRGYTTEKSGTSTFSGNGTNKIFTIAHGLAGTPNTAAVTAGSSDAKGDFYITYDATNITVTYGTAPPSGTNNVVLIWHTEM